VSSGQFGFVRRRILRDFRIGDAFETQCHAVICRNGRKDCICPDGFGNSFGLPEFLVIRLPNGMIAGPLADERLGTAK
jgi:hypothetical protein